MKPPSSEEVERSFSGDGSSLFIAAKHNHKEMVEYLLKQGEGANFDSSGVTALMIALKEGNIEIARMLLSQERLTETDNDDKNVFHHAFDSWKPEEATEVLVEFIYSQVMMLTKTHFVSEVQATPLILLAGLHHVSRRAGRRNGFPSHCQALLGKDEGSPDCQRPQ